VTVTTVGYGDVYPVTPGGRIVAGMLMFFGIGLFSSIAAVFSSWLVQRDAQETSEDEMKLLRSEIGQLRGELAQLINHLAEGSPRDQGPPSKRPETEKPAQE
jgi:voltage-gated potassium channel